jgi:hypothetical protein
MSTVCAFCQSPFAGAETVCLSCGAPLPAASSAAADSPGAFFGGPPPRWADARLRAGRRSAERWERWLSSPAVIVAAFVVIALGAWAVSDRVRKESADRPAEGSGRVRVGMHISEVGRLLDRHPRPGPSYPRMRDWFPADEFGDGTIEHEGDGVRLKIHFVGGFVTSVEESPSSAGPGFQRQQMIVRQR